MGLPEAEWFRYLERGEPLPLPIDKTVDYRGFTRLGPGALLYLGMYAADHGQMDASQGFFEAAHKYEKSWYKTRAAGFLVVMYRESADTSKLLPLLRARSSGMLPYRNAIYLAEALELDGQHDDALAAWRKLRKEFPAESEVDTALVTAGMLKSMLGGDSRGKEAELSALVELLLAMKSTAAVQAGLAAVNEAAATWLSEDLALLVRIRVATNIRDYGLAIRAMRSYVLRPLQSDASATGSSAQSFAAAFISAGPVIRERINNMPYAVLADFARSYFYGSQADSESLFTLISSSSGIAQDRDYLFQFYAGRFARNANKLDEARRYFSKAASIAGGSLDRDAASWYLIDSHVPLNLSDAIRLLSDAYSKTADPAYFADLAERISREALLKRDGSALASLDRACGSKADAKTRARVSYLCARGADLGLISARHINSLPGTAGQVTPREYSASHYRLAYDQEAQQWYRLLAGYRLQLPLDAWLDASVATVSTAISPAAELPGFARLGDGFVPVDYALELVRWFLPKRVRTELSAYFEAMSPADIRRISEALAQGGEHAESIRVIGKVFGRSDYIVEDKDRRLFWPMPFRAEMDGASAESEIASALLYGLVRSESLFMPSAVSSAGASGLSQLMPATAAETARKLGMAAYSLQNPADNIRIGAAFFSALLRSYKGSVLPALFSYNGGPTRYRRWKAEAGDLPDDLILETLPFEETRQYGRNVVHAATMYSILHDDTDGMLFLKNALGEPQDLR